MRQSTAATTFSCLRLSLKTDTGQFEFRQCGASGPELWVNRFPGLPVLLHSAMVFGFSMKVPQYPTRDSPTLMEVICNDEFGKKYFTDGPVLIETSWGLRNRTQVYRDRQWQSERQSHPGQLLAEMAKQGVSLDQELTTQGSVHTVRDLAYDTIATYSHSEPQIEWTCMALILYLPPQKTWIYKFGRQFSFDDMAEELMRSQI